MEAAKVTCGKLVAPGRRRTDGGSRSISVEGRVGKRGLEGPWLEARPGAGQGHCQERHSGCPRAILSAYCSLIVHLYPPDFGTDSGAGRIPDQLGYLVLSEGAVLAVRSETGGCSKYT